MGKSKTNWNRHLIKAVLSERNITLTGIANAYDLNLSRISRGISGSDRVGAEAVAEVMGVPFTELFGDHYPAAPEIKPKNRSGKVKRPNRTKENDSVRPAA